MGICSVDTPCLVSFWTKGRPWQGFSEQFAGPHIWTATPQDYHGMHIQTPNAAPDDQDWFLTQYVFPGEGISNECTNDANCNIESTFTYGCGGCAIASTRCASCSKASASQACATTPGLTTSQSHRSSGNQVPKKVAGLLLRMTPACVVAWRSGTLALT